jgi:hypothetical protein
MATATDVSVDLVQGNALQFPSDVLILKHAQGLYGVDRRAVNELWNHQTPFQLPLEGDHLWADSRRILAAERTLFVGTKPLFLLDYEDLHDFAARSLRIVEREYPTASRVAMTLHGPGFGLDELEATRQLLAGIHDHLESRNRARSSIRTIAVVEIDGRCIERLQRAGSFGPRTTAVGERARIFVAMPYAKEFDDVYYQGVEAAVHKLGLLSERVDLESFTGDVLEQIKRRIGGAQLVIAEVSAPNPNVYLEIGYAWGLGKPTLLVGRSSAELGFDVRGQRRLLYEKIIDLNRKLADELRRLAISGN